MALNLAKPLSQAGMKDPALDAIQENIIKTNGRDRTTHLFFQITDAEKARASLRKIGEKLSSAKAQLDAVTDLRRIKANPSLKLSKAQQANIERASTTLALSHAGYHALKVPSAHIPDDPAFVASMAQRDLDDLPSDVEKALKAALHGVISIGGKAKKPTDASATVVTKMHKAILTIVRTNGGLKIVYEQVGRGYDNKNGEGMEHFGYMDGRSQPLLWQTDIDNEARRNGGKTFVWDPAFALSQALVREAGPHAGFGSYFIFRKLQQDVAGFKDAEEKIGKHLTSAAVAQGMKAIPGELAGAMLVGRFEDGTPVVDPFGFGTVAEGRSHNDFDYSEDPSGGKCPIFAHIRKTNPRDDTLVPGARSRTLVRRGITYGTRDYDAKTGEFMTHKPGKGGVGLLFMAYTSSIAEKFEIIQQHWANSATFPTGTPGIDPVIGQGGQSRLYAFPQGWGGAGSFAPVSFAQFVTFRGGEYFFAPSLTFLRNL